MMRRHDLDEEALAVFAVSGKATDEVKRACPVQLYNAFPVIETQNWVA